MTTNTPPRAPYYLVVGKLPKPGGGWREITYLALSDDIEFVRAQVTDLAERILAAGGRLAGSRRRKGDQR